jgi:hypothetical protein
LVRCGDAWLALTLARDDDRALLPAWLEHPIESVDDVWFELAGLVAQRSSVTLVERAALVGLPCAAVGEVTDARAVLVDQVGDAPARELDGAVVVNLAALWAGPLCADILARLGARLVTVESTRRPDGGRETRRFFNALHGRSESVALDLTSPKGRAALGGLLAIADVVIEGSRPRALEQMGFDARALVAEGPQVWISITAQGRGDRFRDRVGFGDDAAVAGGLVGWVNGEPRFVADAVADPLTGLAAALAVVELLEGGGRWLADIALARVARSAVGDWVKPGLAVAQRPRPRNDPGGSMPLGRDTSTVLSRFRIR